MNRNALHDPYISDVSAGGRGRAAHVCLRLPCVYCLVNEGKPIPATALVRPDGLPTIDAGRIGLPLPVSRALDELTRQIKTAAPARPRSRPVHLRRIKRMSA